MKRSSLVLAALVTLVGLVLAACTPAEEEEAATAASPAAGDATPAVTAPEATSAARDADAGAIADAVEATLEQGSAEVVIDASVAAEGTEQTLRSQGVVDFADDTRQLAVDTAMGEAELLAEPGAYYARVPGLDGWVLLDPQQVPPEAGALATLPLQDPAVNVQLLRGATDDVQELGSEDVRGRSATHHRVVVDVESAIDQADPQAQQAIEGARVQMAADQVEVDVWIDEEGLIRRVRNTADLDEAADLSGTASVDIEFVEFGVDAAFTPPTQDEIIDVDPAALDRFFRGAGAASG